MSALSENRYSSRWLPFSLRLGSELLSIPRRIYYEPPIFQTAQLTGLESEILDCLLTSHADGLVCQKHLARIIRSQNIWIPCFVIPLTGEYVVEILRLNRENLTYLDRSICANFVRANRGLLDLSEQRAISYWDCYYRSRRKSIRVSRFLISLSPSSTMRPAETRSMRRPACAACTIVN